jgi:FkbM family methyltransferase
MKVELLLGCYFEAREARRDELLSCLRLNIANPAIARVHLFAEDVDCRALVERSGTGSKMCWIEHGRRIAFSDLFDYANAILAGRVVAVANADIFFDATLELVARYELHRTLLCLSRWEELPDGPAHFARADSQDAWIFRAPVPRFSCDWHLGIPGCENRLAFEASRAGLRLVNPSRSIRARHLHTSQMRNVSGNARIAGPYRHVPILEEPMQVPGAYEKRPLCALTSLSPSPDSYDAQRAAIRSWVAAGLRPISLNHPSEIDAIVSRYDVEFVPCSETTDGVFGRPYVPIRSMLALAAKLGGPALLINSDIELRLQPWELKRCRWLADGGLCYFVRYNHNGDYGAAQREPHGIDAFLLHGRDAALFPDSLLSMGQPFWDYWIPHVFASSGRPVYAVDHPVAFHRNHTRRWSWTDWHRCAAEFQRMTDALGTDPGQYTQRAWQVRQTFERRLVSVGRSPEPIEQWVRRRFGGRGQKLFLELGSHRGTDTAWMAAIPDVTIHTFEPDPRNESPCLPNVISNRAAVAERDGVCRFVLSKTGWGQEWTHSSSIRAPKFHLSRYPVTFGEAIEVEAVSLDSYARRTGLGRVDFIWADIQGAEGDMVRGGRDLLARTRYVFTEYSDDELYEGQATLDEILELLPEFRVIELYEDDVLLENMQLANTA